MRDDPDQFIFTIDYRVEIAMALCDTREAIRKALGHIERQEDGPLTMQRSIKDIESHILILESALNELRGSLEVAQRMAARVRQQRDEALRMLIWAKYGL